MEIPVEAVNIACLVYDADGTGGISRSLMRTSLEAALPYIERQILRDLVSNGEGLNGIAAAAATFAKASSRLDALE